MPTKHAKLGPSGAHRWLHCLGSVKAEEGKPNTTSIFAQEGTAAHGLAEICLRENQNPFDWVDKPAPDENAITVDREMASGVQFYIDYIKSLKGIPAYEVEVDLSQWIPDSFGTSDAIICSEPVLHVVDLKYGKGVAVDATNNEQGMLYALGAYALYESIYEFETVNIAIVQPRLDSISEWSISVPDLLKWGEWASQRANEALNNPNAPRTPGESQCKWCKAKSECPALLKVTHEATIVHFDDETGQPPSPEKLTDSQLRFILDNKTLIESFLKAVEDRVSEQLLEGKAFEGYKIVEGRSLRQWSDENQAVLALTDLLGDEAYTKKLISPSQAEKALGKAKSKALQDLIVKPEGKPTLAKSDDPRKPFTTSASVDDF